MSEMASSAPVIDCAWRYCSAVRISMARLSLDLGYDERWLYRAAGRGDIAADSRARLVAHLAMSWPEKATPPAVIRNAWKLDPGLLKERNALLERQRRRKTGPRACLVCASTFESEGAHNRMCANCRGRASFLDNQMVG